MAANDYYKLLQVDVEADPEMIEAAYRRLARRYHPDLNKSPEAAEMMRRLNEAKETLMNAATRRRYDATRGVGWGNWSKPQGSYAAGNGASGGAYQNSSSGLPSLQMILMVLRLVRPLLLVAAPLLLMVVASRFGAAFALLVLGLSLIFVWYRYRYRRRF